MIIDRYVQKYRQDSGLGPRAKTRAPKWLFTIVPKLRNGQISKVSILTLQLKLT